MPSSQQGLLEDQTVQSRHEPRLYCTQHHHCQVPPVSLQENFSLKPWASVIVCVRMFSEVTGFRMRDAEIKGTPP